MMIDYTYDTTSQELKGVFTIVKDNDNVIIFIVDGDPITNNSEHEVLYADMVDAVNQQRFAELLNNDPNTGFRVYLETRPPNIVTGP